VGSDTLFWTDPWVEGIPLSERFGRLFDLAETKRYTVAEMFTLGWGAGGEAWVWRRQFRGWGVTKSTIILHHRFRLPWMMQLTSSGTLRFG
jgi:hypothetical protein